MAAVQTTQIPPEQLLQTPSLVTLSAFVLVLSVVTALLEVQIEGEYGWAKKLPTWRYGPPWILRLFNGKELTGYHLWLFTMFVLFFHLPMLYTRWSWSLEFTVLTGLTMFTVFWDYLWFVFNPSFGLRRYNRMNIWWFKDWLGPFPRDYYTGLLASAFFAAMHGYSSAHSNVQGSLIEWLIGVGVCVLGATAISVIHVFYRGPTVMSEKIPKH